MFSMNVTIGTAIGRWTLCHGQNPGHYAYKHAKGRVMDLLTGMHSKTSKIRLGTAKSIKNKNMDRSYIFFRTHNFEKNFVFKM